MADRLHLIRMQDVRTAVAPSLLPASDYGQQRGRGGDQYAERETDGILKYDASIWRDSDYTSRPVTNGDRWPRVMHRLLFDELSVSSREKHVSWLSLSTLLSPLIFSSLKCINDWRPFHYCTAHVNNNLGIIYLTTSNIDVAYCVLIRHLYLKNYVRQNWFQLTNII